MKTSTLMELLVEHALAQEKTERSVRLGFNITRLNSNHKSFEKIFTTKTTKKEEHPKECSPFSSLIHTFYLPAMDSS